MRIKFLAAAAAVILFCSPATSAESPGETLESFGFFGRWATDCNQPASPDNNVRTAQLSPAGDPVFSESLGSEPNSYVVFRVRRTGADTIILRTKLNGEIIQELTMHRQGDRIRTIANRDMASGGYLVRKGVVVSTKRETPWLTRCGAQESRSGKEI